MTSNIMLFASCALSGLMGCAAIIPVQLVEAREAYAKSSSGPAAKLMPTELYDAKKVLDQSNQSFEDHGDTVPKRGNTRSNVPSVSPRAAVP